MSTLLRRWRAVLIPVLAVAVLGTVAALATPAAHATTGTCLNIATPISQPIGCGGLYFSGLGAGIQPNSTSLTLTATNPQWNSHVTDAVYDPARSDQDWTVYQVCSAVSGPRSAAQPCGTLGTVTLDGDGQAEFVAEATPLGHHLGGTLNNSGNLCLSVEGVFNGPIRHHHHTLRYRTVLRTCNSLGAVFTAGFPDGSSGVTGVVTSPNHFQTWSPVGPVSNGFVMVNNALSGAPIGGTFNHPFVLDVPGGSHTPGAWLLVYPENDQANQVARIIGCTGAPNQITPGHFDCP